METAAVIGLVLAALFLGALFPVLFQLRATLAAAQKTLAAAERTINDVHGMAPALRSTLVNVERVSETLTAEARPSGTLATLSELLPVALSVFRALTGRDDDPEQPADACAPGAAPNPPTTPQGESA